MTAISPELGARLANGVYSLTKREKPKDAITDLNLMFGDIFTFSEEALLKAKTGGPWFIKCRTAFGFTLLGRGHYKVMHFFSFAALSIWQIG